LSDAPFIRYGPEHLGALFATALFAAALALAVRRSRDPRVARWVTGGLAALLVGVAGAVVVHGSLGGDFSWWDYAPLQLCDLAVFVSAYALLTRRQTAYELAWFWGGAGTLIAMITPDVGSGFPSWEFAFFFALHGAVVAAAVVLTLGLGLRPRRGAALRVLLITNIYALFLGGVNLATGSNFMYLCRKPAAGSLLDWLGPWPVYLLAGEVVALALFLALEAPFRLGERPLSLDKRQ
jgi:hypothetical integral membrane protein (TIGR02206 family)